MEQGVSSLLHFFSCSHSACDAIIQQRDIYLPNAYDIYKSESTLYFRLAFIVVWEVVVIYLGIRAWRRPPVRALDALWRYASFFFGGFGLIWLVSLFIGMSQYADVCERLLHGQPVPNLSHTSNVSGSVMVFAIGMVLLISGISIFVRRKEFAELQMLWNEQRSPVIRGMWESLGLGMDRTMAMVWTYILAGFLAFLGVAITLLGVAVGLYSG